MYADFSHDRVKAFFKELTEKPQAQAEPSFAEDFSDEMMLAEMEFARFRKSKAEMQPFVQRRELLMSFRRAHPADFQ